MDANEDRRPSCEGNLLSFGEVMGVYDIQFPMFLIAQVYQGNFQRLSYIMSNVLWFRRDLVPRDPRESKTVEVVVE